MKMLTFVTSFKKILIYRILIEYRNNIFLRKAINALKALA